MGVLEPAPCLGKVRAVTLSCETILFPVLLIPPVIPDSMFWAVAHCVVWPEHDQSTSPDQVAADAALSVLGRLLDCCVLQVGPTPCPGLRRFLTARTYQPMEDLRSWAHKARTAGVPDLAGVFFPDPCPGETDGEWTEQGVHEGGDNSGPRFQQRPRQTNKSLQRYDTMCMSACTQALTLALASLAHAAAVHSQAATLPSRVGSSIALLPRLNGVFHAARQSGSKWDTPGLHQLQSAIQTLHGDG